MCLQIKSDQWMKRIKNIAIEGKQFAFREVVILQGQGKTMCSMTTRGL